MYICSLPKRISLTLIKSISGIRGTIGGFPGKNLTPIDIVECTAGLATWLMKRNGTRHIVVGRDGRLSGQMVSQLAIQTLSAMGIRVTDLGYSTTPTVEVMVPRLGAGAGIIFTASHNPGQWNALKFLNQEGEFISAEDGQEIIDLISAGELEFATVDALGEVETFEGSIDYHIGQILDYKHVLAEEIKRANLHVVVDCINSTGVLAIPPLLDKLGVRYTLLNDTNFGHFAHNPEPLPQHLQELSAAVVAEGAHMGISIDPDVDRLAFVCEDGTMFGEEYTLVAIADHILSREPGNTVSNLSSTRALADVTARHAGKYYAAAVGEVNVVRAMKQCNAVIGGEGNGGVIVPDLHYGRDAMAGIALFLSLFAQRMLPMTHLKATYPAYTIIKDKVDLDESRPVERTLEKLEKTFHHEKLNTEDGLKIDFASGWVHLRKSNTEPIMRIYCEASTEEEARNLIEQVKKMMD
jgi:phosphomannomutase